MRVTHSPTRHRVLVVDDNPSIQEDIRKILVPEAVVSEALAALETRLFGETSAVEGGHQFAVESAHQGQEGVEKVRAAVARGQPYSVAFVDMRMPPGLDGIETTTRMWAEDPELQVVLCTAYSDYSWSEMTARFGHRDGLLVLKKPFDNIEVSRMAHALAEKWALGKQVRDRLTDLEARVTERTRALEEANERLRREMADRERLETKMRVSQKLDAIGQLAAGVAHEINNPLTYVISNLGFLAEELRAMSGPQKAHLDELCEAVSEAQHGAQRARVIVRDLKTFSRVDEDASRPVDLRSVVESTISMASNEIRHRARLVSELRPVPYVDGNEARLGQVFLNLLVNAAQAIPEGAADRHRIRVSTDVDAAGRAVVEVSDTGPGISPENLPRIFDPFFTTKPVGSGTGLGLSICHGIITAIGGDLQVESRLGAGTTFRVSLPTLAKRPEQPPSIAPTPVPSFGVAPAQAAQPRHARILVVDDEYLIVSAIHRILGGQYEVALETDARAALARIRRGEEFDLILCDVMMPEMSGADLHAEVTRLVPEMVQRMVFLTGGAFTPRARQFLESVPNRRMEKPFDGPALLHLVASYLADRPGADRREAC